MNLLLIFKGSDCKDLRFVGKYVHFFSFNEIFVFGLIFLVYCDGVHFKPSLEGLAKEMIIHTHLFVLTFFQFDLTI